MEVLQVNGGPCLGGGPPTGLDGGPCLGGVLIQVEVLVYGGPDLGDCPKIT